MQRYQNGTNCAENQDIIAETAVVLELLAFAFAIVAQPSTPAVLSQAMAILGYNCALNWAALLQEEGVQ